jgi:D-alanine-D-alanine ligase
MPKPASGLPAESARLLEDRALAAWDAIGLEGYGRIDMRFHEKRGPLVLDVNPNPDISPDAGLALAAKRGGIAYEELIARIVRDALRRRRQPA